MNKPLYNESVYKFSRMILPAMALAAIGAHKMGFPTVCYCILGAALVLCVPVVNFYKRLEHCKVAEQFYGEHLIRAFSGKGQKKLRYKLIDAIHLLDKKEKPGCGQTQKILIKDVRFFLNTVTRGAETMRASGIDAELLRSDTDEEIVLNIRIPKR